MNISGFAKADIAELPPALSAGAAPRVSMPQDRIAKGDDDIVITMRMPERRVAGRHGNIPDAYEFIFKFRVMPGLAADFNR